MLDDAVATRHTVTQIIAAVRAVIRKVPGADAVAAAQCGAHDYTAPDKPRIARNDEQARAELVDPLLQHSQHRHHHAPLDQGADTRRRYASLTPSETMPDQQNSWDRIRLGYGS